MTFDVKCERCSMVVAVLETDEADDFYRWVEANNARVLCWICEGVEKWQKLMALQAASRTLAGVLDRANPPPSNRGVSFSGGGRKI